MEQRLGLRLRHHVQGRDDGDGRAFTRLTEKRRRKALQEAARWARQAFIAAAHWATKASDTVTDLSASATKTHRGEATPQRAADKGAEEWAAPWKASNTDAASDILAAVEAIEVVDSTHEEIALPPIDEDRIYKIVCKIAGRTGVGLCGLRPRHLLLVSRACRIALAEILMRIERRRRWPDVLREVVEVALGKKAGGARLVGLTSTLYRVWAGVRYFDCRATLESRSERPFLSAAPKRGAELAAFDMAREAEIATARNEQTAATMVDIVRFFMK